MIRLDGMGLPEMRWYIGPIRALWGYIAPFAGM